MKTQKDTNAKLKEAVASEKKVATLKKVVAAVNAGEISKENLSPVQKEVVKKVNALKGIKTEEPAAALPTKAQLKKQAQEAALNGKFSKADELLKQAEKTVDIPASHDKEIDALVDEINEDEKASGVAGKKRAPRGTILTSADKIEDKNGKPWGKFGLHGTNQTLEGFETGDRVLFNLKGEQTEGVYSHFHINNHSPKGYLVIKIGKKIFERVAEKVTKIQPQIEEAAAIAEPILKSGSTTKEREAVKKNSTKA